MAYSFESLPQLTDQRGRLPRNGSYTRRNRNLRDCTRAWHHSLTRKHLGGSTAHGFATYHVNSLGWPGVGYHLVIEPKNVVDTANGKRARIVYANDITLRTYHVGNSNDFAIGICVAGDYRYDELDEPTIASISELQAALAKDNLGKDDKSHHEFAGYAWKQCCVFDYKRAFSFLPSTPVQEQAPEVYTVQSGDTLWGLANNDDRFTVEDLMNWNNIDDPKTLRVGKQLYLRPQQAGSEPTTPPARRIQWIGITKPSWLNVRKGPGVSYPAVSQLRQGSEVTVYGEQNGWLDIGNGQFVSNVNNQYVDRKSSSSSNLAGRRVEAIVASVNFYDTPRWSNPTGQFTRGHGWTIIEQITTEGYAQYKVRNSRGRIYYITARKDLVRVV